MISGNGGKGITVGADNSTVQGNYIGIQADGTAALANAGYGIDVEPSVLNATIGGAVAGAGNVISGNSNAGILFEVGSTGSVKGNLIGTNAAGTAVISGIGAGVYIATSGVVVGGTTAAEANTITGSSTHGVIVTSAGSSANTILRNSIYGNAGQAIDLANNGITANDAGDPDSGANGLQNFPLLTSANVASTGTTIVGSLNSNANTSYRIEFYGNRPTVADATNGEGETYLGFVNVTTDGSGNASFNTLLTNVWVSSRSKVTATATVDLGGGNYGSTSEFAANVLSGSTGVIVVDTTSDVADGTTTSINNLGSARGADGYISLREAITTANNSANGGSPDKIVFAIPGTGPFVINVGSSLPTITQALVIDGTSQAGFDADNSRPVVVLDANNFVFDVLTLSSTADGSTIRGLSIRDSGATAITLLSGSDGNTITGNYLGALDPSGAHLAGEGNDVDLSVAGANNTIGGTTAALRNFFGGSTFASVEITGASATGNLVLGNSIGVAADGSTAVASAGIGVVVYNGASNNRVGGSSVGEGNVIANHGRGVVVGVNTVAATATAILGNSIYSNTGLGIDLGWDNAVLANDAGDVDGGVNAGQNYPVLTAAIVKGNDLTVTGTLNSVASGTYRVGIFSNTSVDASGNGEGQVYLGYVNVSTDASGNAAWAVTLPYNEAAGRSISATATASNASFSSFTNTSEFAANIMSVQNSAPANTVPGAQTTNEDTNKVFSAANGNAITVADADAGGTNNEVSLSVTNGTLTLFTTAGLSFTAGDGTADATMTLRGTAAAINAALDGLIFTPSANYNGGAVLTLATQDALLLSLDIDATLLGRYAFNGSAGDSGPGTAQNGTLMGGAGYVFDSTRGQVLNLVNSGDYVQVSGTYSNPANVTLAGWVDLDAVTTRGEFISLDDHVLISLDDSSSGGGVSAGIMTGAGSWQALGSNQFIAGTGWHHLAYTYDDTNNVHTLYIDGVAAASGTITSSIYWTGATNTLIGKHPGAGNYIDARVDEVRIYNRALTAAEVAALAADQALTDTDTVALTVTAANDAPVLADTALTLTVAEDAGLPSGAVGSLISAFTGSSSDIDSSPSKGIAITGTVETNGVWYYSTNGGTNWAAVGVVNSTSALLLADDGNTRLYFATGGQFQWRFKRRADAARLGPDQRQRRQQGEHRHEWRNVGVFKRHRCDRRDGDRRERRTGAGRHRTHADRG